MNEKRKEYQRKYREKYKTQAKRVNLTLSKEEYRDFVRAAKSEKKKTSTYIKELALAGLENQAYVPSELQDELKTLRFAIRNIANNVNQIAHYSNIVRSVSTENENNLLQHIKQLEEAIYQYTEGRILKNSDDR